MRLGSVGRAWECRLWYYSTQALDEAVREQVERDGEQQDESASRPSASYFVRRALGAYLAHLAAGGRPEREPARVPGDKRTSATLKCYATMPSGLRLRFSNYLKTLPHRTDEWGREREWPHSSRKSLVIRQALRWWLRRHP